jgi:hypothetical protein
VFVPNPKNEKEEFSFQFNGVYEGSVSQEEIFDLEGERGVLLVPFCQL